jgi:hypothetical protein
VSFFQACWGCRTLLLTTAGDDGGVHIHRETVYAQTIKKPAVDLFLHLFVHGHIKAVEEMHDGFVSGDPGPAKEPRKGCIKTSDFGVRKAVRPAPDADQKLFNDLHRFITSIGAGLWQVPLFGHFGKPNALEHSSHQRQATPNRNLAGSETDLKIVCLAHRHVLTIRLII